MKSNVPHPTIGLIHRLIEAFLTPKPFLRLKYALFFGLIGSLGIDIVLRFRLVEFPNPLLPEFEFQLLGPGFGVVVACVFTIGLLVGADFVLRLRQQDLHSKLLEAIGDLPPEAVGEVVNAVIRGAHL